ncbi:MAG: S9 family peptidase, partial [Flavobacteriaceae bacterium]|nr:S9 family peptidase [Flavobacteriaceae bacterium]
MILNLKKILAIITIIFLTNYSESLAQSIQWNNDESGFYRIKNNELILHSTKGDKEIIIISKKDLSPINSTPLKLKGYQFSIDRNKALIFTNTKRVWRHETKGDYWILDLNNKKLTKLGKGLPESSLMFAKFSPDGNNVAYVSKENTNKARNSTTNANIFIENLSNNQIKKLTSSNGTKKLINGTFDWAYEEEFNCRDGFLFNNSGTKIAFWQIDANQVRDFYMMNNTDSIYSFNVPVEYPKVGQNPSPAKIGVINLINNNSITWIKIPGAPDNNYLPRMTWSPNSDELFIQQLNRKQNHSKLLIANTSTGSTKLLMEEKDNTWVDVRSSWPNQVQSGWKFINKGKEILYTTEKDGWSHIYRFNINTKKEYLITKGEYDVTQSLAVDEKSKLLYFIASPNNATQRYLYKVRLDGKGKLEMVTPNELEGSHNYQISPKANFAFHKFSNYYTKPMSQLIR